MIRHITILNKSSSMLFSFQKYKLNCKSYAQNRLFSVRDIFDKLAMYISMVYSIHPTLRKITSHPKILEGSLLN